MRSLDELIRRASCRALVVVAGSSRDPFLAPFVGQARLGEAILVAVPQARPRLGYLSPLDRDEAASTGLPLLDPEALDVVRWAREGAEPEAFLANVLSRALHLSELGPGRLALAGHWIAGTVHAACGRLAEEGWSFAAGEAIVATLRKYKTSEQLAEISKVAAATCQAFRGVAEALAASEERGGELWLSGEPLRIAKLRSLVARVFAEHGLEQPAGNIMAAAEQGAVPHTSGEDHRILAPGESLIVDLFPRGRLFADCTRTFCIGEAPEPLARAHAQVREALRLARDLARPGVRGWSLQESVCEHFAAAGYPTPITDPGTTSGYVHGLGHGVGFELHELPSFKEEAGDTGLLEAGDVITLEPGLYDQAAGYAVRLEDLYTVTETGVECLTPLPYDLDPRAWWPVRVDKPTCHRLQPPCFVDTPC